MDTFLRGLAAHLEDSLQFSRVLSFQRRKLVKARVILDCRGLGISFLLRMKAVQQIIKFCLAYYPEGLASATVVRAPRLCTAFAKGAKVFMPASMQAKFRICGEDFADELKEHAGIDISILPTFLGGQSSDHDVCQGFGATVSTPDFAKRYLEAARCSNEARRTAGKDDMLSCTFIDDH